MPLRIAVAGGTGVVGRLVADLVRVHGHEPVVLSRSTGIDLRTGGGLDAVLRGVDVVIDVSGTATRSSAAVEQVETMARTLRDAEVRAGVAHHVVLSIVGVDGAEGAGSATFRGKLAQERVVTDGPVPWTLLRSTQFHEFAGQLHERMSLGPFVLVPMMRSQPVAAREVAARVLALAEGSPAGRVADIAGPGVERMAELARRYGRAAGLPGRVVELSVPGAFGRRMRGGGLLPGPDADVRGPAFADWLAGETGSDGTSTPHNLAVAGIPLVRAPLPSAPEPALSNARALIAQLQATGMPIVLAVEGVERALPPAVDEAAFRALQEGVSLVLTRTRGADVAAAVRYLPHAVEIEVAHGRAELTATAGRSSELDRSRAAVRRLGGMVASVPTADGGLRLSATIPTSE